MTSHSINIKWCYEVSLIQPKLIEKYLRVKSNSIIGATVTVTVDRPLGSYHPEYKDMYYPINYGYIERVMAPDGMTFSKEEIRRQISGHSMFML